jgi:predicted dehydrogenase
VNRKARIAVIGAGWWAARNHLPLLRAHSEVTITGICGVDAESLSKVQAAFGIAFATQDFRELLDREPIDGVVVSSPHTLHYEHARAAILKGCHVLVEKPFTTAADQARELAQLERQAGITVVIPLGYNFSDMAQAAALSVRSGSVGKLQHAVLHMATPTADLLLGKALSATQSHLLQPSTGTWADASRAGGFGWGQLSHALGLLFMLAEDDPAVVFAAVERADSGVDLHDAATVCFRSGATCAISGSSGLATGAPSQLDLRLFGESGTLGMDFAREELLVYGKVPASPVARTWPGSGTYACERPVKFFVDVCLGRGGTNLASSAVGRRSTEVLEAMYRSASSGRPELISTFPQGVS